MQTGQGAPLRAEVIGSLLRPRALKDAAVAVSRGQLDRQAFGAVLDREVADVIRRQERQRAARTHEQHRAATACARAG